MDDRLKNIPIIFIEDGIKKTETLKTFFLTRPIFHINKHPTKKFMRIITAYSIELVQIDGVVMPKYSAIVFCTALYWKFVKPVIKNIFKKDLRKSKKVTE